MNPRRKLRARLAAVVTAVCLTTAGLTTFSAATASASTTSDGSGGFLVDAGYLRVGLNSTGQVTSLVDSRSGQNYVASGHGTAPLVSLVIGGAQVLPTSLTLGANNTLIFTNVSAGYEVDVAVQDKATYTTFTVTKETAPSTSDVQTLLWGPLATSITQTVGETVGVVHNADFAVGMKVLTDRTEGGWPREEQGTSVGWQNQVAPDPTRDSVGPEEEWSVGGVTSWGSLLRAFTYDYTVRRDRMTDVNGGTLYPVPVGPLPGNTGSVVGSKIALFGTTPNLALTVLSNIATGQNLPYPTFGGQWEKSAQAGSQSDMDLDDLDTGNVVQAAQYAKEAGLSTMEAIGNNGPWVSNGHFDFDSDFGGSDSNATALVNQAKQNGVGVGVHQLSDFIAPNDSYVTPTPSPDLALGQSTTLTRPLASTDTTAYLASCAPLAAGVLGSQLLIGSEYISYAGYSQDGSECQVTGLSRAQWNSTAASYTTGTTISRLIENEDGGAQGGLNTINAIATRLATIFNTTGINETAFDGLESASQVGWGSYGISTLVNGTYRQMNQHDGFISETSRMTSNIWDVITRASWGESTQSLAQVLTNNAYYQANYMPGALGWKYPSSSTVQQLQDLLAIGAGLNAGTDFRSTVAALAADSSTPTKLNDIKQWETARNLGAFTPAERVRLQDPSLNWTLTNVTPGLKWTLQQVDTNGNAIGSALTVAAPTPAFTTTSLPAMTTGSLYEAQVVTNNPETVHYAVTSGALPAGLTLNADTGGITGVPTSATAATFTVTGTGGSGTANAVASFTIAAPGTAVTGALNLAPAYNNIAVTSQSDTVPGNFDGVGNSYSAEQLATAGITPGATVTAPGSTFVWPGAAAGTNDNVEGAAVIQASGYAGTKIAFLGAEAGSVTGTVTVTYTDGTTSTGALGFPNWVGASPTQFGSTLVAGTTGRNLQTGYGDTGRTFQLFYNDIPINPDKTISTVTLPSNSAIHVFAATVDKPAAGRLNLQAAFNNVGITSQSDTAPGNFDGVGNSYSAEQLAAAGVTPGSTVAAGAVHLTWPNVAAGTDDNASGGASVIQGEGLGGGSLVFLGAEAGNDVVPVAVNYTDGTSTLGTVQFPNWTSPPLTEYSATSLISTTGRNLQSGYTSSGAFVVYSYAMTIDPTKTIASIVLPSTGQAHIFAVSTGS